MEKIFCQEMRSASGSPVIHESAEPTACSIASSLKTSAGDLSDMDHSLPIRSATLREEETPAAWIVGDPADLQKIARDVPWLARAKKMRRDVPVRIGLRLMRGDLAAR